MAEQNFLAKLGIRLGVLGSAANLAFAAPLAAGNLSPTANTDASRLGVWFDRTPGVEATVFNVLGTDIARVGVDGIQTVAGAAAGPGYGFLSDTDTGMYQFAANVLGFSAGGVAIMQASATEVTIDGKLTVTGLIDPTGMEFIPVGANPGGAPAATLWVNSGDSNRLYFGAAALATGGSGTVTSVGVSSTDLSVAGSPITTSGSFTLNINAAAVTLAKMANLAANSIVGNNTGSPATPLALTSAQATAMLDAFTSGLKGLAPASGGGSTNFLRADGTWAAPGGAGTVTSVGVSSTDLSVAGSPITTSGSFTLNINAAAVTLAKMANLAANSIVGNNTGSPATPLALTSAQATAMLDAFTSGLKGLAPASGGGSTNFLRADGTWAAPVSGGTPGGADTNVQFNSAGAFGGDASFTYTTGAKVTIPAGTSSVPGIQFTGTANRGLFKSTNGIGITDGTQYVEWYPFSGALVSDTGGGLTSFDQYIGAVISYSATTSRLRVPAGTVAAPGLQFAGATDHGVYPTAAGVSFALGGSNHLEAGRSGAETYFDTPGSSTTMGFYLGAAATHKATTAKFSVPAGSAGAPGLQFLTGAANVGLFNYGGAAPGLGFSLNASATENMWASAVVPGYVRWDTGTGITRWQWAINGTIKLELDTTTGLTVPILRVGDGTAAAPAYSFTSLTNAGMYLTAGTLVFGYSGAQRLAVNDVRVQAYVPFYAPSTTAASAPAYAFGSDTNTGMANPSADVIGFNVAGTEVVRIGTVSLDAGALRVDGLRFISSIVGTAAAPVFTHTADDNTGMYFVAADTLGFSAGGATTLSITATEATITGGLVVTGSVAIRDSAFVIQDGGDLTKQAAFQCSGITTGTTRTFTFPDASGTLAVLGLAQTWTATQSFAAVNASGAVTLADTVLAGYLGAVEDDAGTTRNVTTTDTGAVIRFTSGSAITVTLNASATVGTTMTIVQYGAGQITFTPAGGATLVNRLTHTKTAGQYAVISLVVLANAGSAAIWALAGDTAA